MNKIIVITGASNGLGKELSRIYARNGYVLILTGRNKNRLDEFNKRNIDIVIGDLTCKETLEHITDVIVNKYKKIDILINNAGIVAIQPFDKNTDEQLDALFEINIKSHMKLTQKLYPLMKRQRSGHIINIISTAGMEGKLNHTMYCATKYAMQGFTESLRLEAKKFNIKVTGIYPGAMKTHAFDTLPQAIDQSTFMNAAHVAKAIFNLSQVKDISPDRLVISRMNFVEDSLYGITT